MKTTIRFVSLRTILIFSVLGVMAACKKDNPPPADNNTDPIIDPPVPTVTLNTHFYGLIDGTPLEFTQNVSGYNGAANHNYYLLPSPSYSSAVYRFLLSSPSFLPAIEIFQGSVYWDRGVDLDPTLMQVNTFFQTNLTPAYTTDGQDGFEVQYTDNTGAIWRSNGASVNPQDATFSGLVSESDTTGDYTKFTVDFNCFVYNATFTDSIHIQNAQLKGWFKR
jgi:hypothetical protein